MRTRISKLTYGVLATIAYDPNDPDHKSRPQNVYTDFTGAKRINGRFGIILPKVSCLFPHLQSMLLKIYLKNTQVSEMKEFKNSYHRSLDISDDLQAVAFSFWCYRGNLVTPMWKDVDASESLLTIIFWRP